MVRSRLGNNDRNPSNNKKFEGFFIK